MESLSRPPSVPVASQPKTSALEKIEVLHIPVDGTDPYTEKISLAEWHNWIPTDSTTAGWDEGFLHLPGIERFYREERCRKRLYEKEIDMQHLNLIGVPWGCAGFRNDSNDASRRAIYRTIGSAPGFDKVDKMIRTLASS